MIIIIERNKDFEDEVIANGFMKRGTCTRGSLQIGGRVHNVRRGLTLCMKKVRYPLVDDEVVTCKKCQKVLEAEDKRINDRGGTK
jgi:hypothetical protein